MSNERRRPREAPGPLGVVTTTELSRSPHQVLARVAAGERLIVVRHKRPVATLQPLNGVVLQLEASVQDIYGWPVDAAFQEATKLSESQRELLIEARNGYLRPMALAQDFDFGGLIESIREMSLRGLTKRTHRGWELTGRGMVLREALLQEQPAPTD